MQSVKMILLLLIFLSLSPVLKAEESSPALRDVSQKLLLLESKVSRLSASQEQIVQKHEQISQELDSLRIWIRRHRN